MAGMPTIVPSADLGISWSSALPSVNGVLDKELYADYGDSHPHLYLHWVTDTGTDWIESFNVAVTWRVIPKGAYGMASTGWTPVYVGYYSSLDAAAECHPSQPTSYSGYQWWCDLGEIGEFVNDPGAGDEPVPSGSTVGEQLAPNGWGFSQRIYDAIELNVGIRSIFAEDKGGLVESYQPYNRFEKDVRIIYRPEYELESLTFSESGVVAEYSVTDWDRIDDRFGVEHFRQGGVNLSPYPGYYGVIDKPGRLTIPSSAFMKLPTATGGACDVFIRMNTPSRPLGEVFGELRGTTSIIDPSVCNTPTLALSGIDANSLSVRVGDSGDNNNPFDVAHVSLVGSPQGFDTVEVAPNGIAQFACPPTGVTIEVQAYGTTDEGGVSSVASLEIPPIGGVDWLTITPIDSPGDSVEMRYNVSEDWSFEPEMEVVKFSGRERESVAYGAGGSVVGTLSCDIIDDESYGAMHQGKADFERLPFLGLCLLRGPDGERKIVAVDSVGESWSIVRRHKTMKVSVREVS